MKKLLTTILLISTISLCSSLRVVTEVNNLKLVNGNSGLEFLAKASINLQDDIVLKIGVSETYTAHRSSIYSFNHNMLRMDIGVYWIIANNFMVGYTHSQRNLIDGATNTDVFNCRSVDILSVRKEFNLEF